MRRISALAVVAAVTLVACGSDDATVNEPAVEVDEAEDDAVMRLAGSDVKVINGCRIEPNTRCPRADLSGADLRNADLSGAVLTAANLQNAELDSAELRDAILWAADLSGANLSGADLSAADLSAANLRGADLSAAMLWRANLSAADLWGADLSGADLSGANLLGAELRGEDLGRAGADLGPTTLCATTMPDGRIDTLGC